MVLLVKRTWCAAWLWLVCAASLAAITAQAHSHSHSHDAHDAYGTRKRAELVEETYLPRLPDHQFPSREVRAQSKFWSGSRYGRSGHGGGGSGSQPRFEVEPRGDRFFMGSRYGKRAGRFPVRTTRMSAYNNLAPYELLPPAVPQPLRPRR